MNVRYVTLAYGDNEAVYREATVLVVSLLAYAPQPREIVAVTDHAERFDWLGDAVGLYTITPPQLEAWRGPNPFSMRQKLEAARALEPSQGAFVLLDADTIAVADLSPLVAALSDGALLMHRREFELGASRRRGNRMLWDQLRGRLFGPWQFRADDAMWNSGVLALRARDARLIDDALWLYDALAAAGIRHFATEQLVVGLVLGRTGRLREARQWFTHYWGNKQDFDREIASRLEAAQRAGRTPAEAADELRRNPIELPAEVRPGQFEKLRRWLTAR